MAKRGNGEGTIKQLASGRWVWIAMDGRKADGTVNYVRVHGDTRAELTKKIENFKQQRKNPKQIVPIFSHYAEAWYTQHQHNLRLSSQSTYPYTLRKLVDYFGDRPIDQIKVSDIVDMLAHYSSIVSGSYLRKVRSMACQIFDMAEADGYIAKNPVRYAVFRTAEQLERFKDAFTLSEIDTIVSSDECKMQHWVTIMIATGLRTQEVLALRGSDITPDGSAITIQRAINMDGNRPVLGLTKSDSSMRTVPVPAVVRPIAACYSSCGDHLIWGSPITPGTSINPSTFRAAFRSFCQNAGVRALTPHCCRHTYASQLHAHGVDLITTKWLMGHSRSDVTEGYLHVSRAELEQAANKLNDLFVSDKQFAV